MGNEALVGHIFNSRIDKDELFDKIDEGIESDDFMKTPAERKMLNDYKDNSSAYKGTMAEYGRATTVCLTACRR